MFTILFYRYKIPYKKIEESVRQWHKFPTGYWSMDNIIEFFGDATRHTDIIVTVEH